MKPNTVIDFEDDCGNDSATNELEEYLIQSKKSQGASSIFSGFVSSVQKYVPKRTGTGSIEDDIAVRFGNLFGSSNSSPSTSAAGTAASNASSTANGGCCGFKCALVNQIFCTTYNEINSEVI